MKNILLSAIAALALVSASSAFAAETKEAAKPAEAPAKKEEAKPLTKSDVELIVKDYLYNNPEIIISSVQHMQEKKQDEERKKTADWISKNKDKIQSGKIIPTAGNPKGDITVVEFFDYNCGYCKHVYPDVQKLVSEDKNIKIVFREFPILGEDSVTASKISLAFASLYPAKYFDFHGEMMKSDPHKDEASIKDIVKKLGGDVNKVMEKSKTADVQAAIDENKSLAEGAGVRGTPAFLIGDEFIPGAASLDDLKKVIGEQRAKKKK